MNTAWALGGIFAIVAAILFGSRRPSWQRLFRWLPVPLWCYALPMMAVAAGWLPREQAGHPIYRHMTNQFLPIALGLLLLGVELPSLIQVGRRALIAAALGAVGVMLGAALSVWALQAYLPAEAWKGAGALAATWTGGTMNLLSLRSILQTPDAIFAPLIVVDAVVAYSWMALLVAASGFHDSINRWLRIPASQAPLHGQSTPEIYGHARAEDAESVDRLALVLCVLVVLGLALGARLLATRLPASQLVSSATGWTVLVVTTAALGLSLVAPVRRIGKHGSLFGYPCLYVVLAATGAQASLGALWASPVWIMVGIGTVTVHGLAMLLAGRIFRIPLGLLATASQANIGGVVSAPLVGAVYHQSLAPVGLLLAMAENAVGTYLGLLAASLCRALVGGG